MTLCAHCVEVVYHIGCDTTIICNRDMYFLTGWSVQVSDSSSVKSVTNSVLNPKNSPSALVASRSTANTC